MHSMLRAATCLQAAPSTLARQCVASGRALAPRCRLARPSLCGSGGRSIRAPRAAAGLLGCGRLLVRAGVASSYTRRPQHCRPRPLPRAKTRRLARTRGSAASGCRLPRWNGSGSTRAPGVRPPCAD
eukprot:scaffold101833_cov72-Phaeocystis_antarctica.AAC.3